MLSSRCSEPRLETLLCQLHNNFLYYIFFRLGSHEALYFDFAFVPQP